MNHAIDGMRRGEPRPTLQCVTDERRHTEIELSELEGTVIQRNVERLRRLVHAAIFVVAAFALGGCTASSVRSQPLAAAPDGKGGALLPSVADLDDSTRPGDVFVNHHKSGERYNKSLEGRRKKRAAEVLAAVTPKLKRASPEELIAGLRSEQGNHVEYYVFRDGNKLIKDELESRERVRCVLQDHSKDQSPVFAGTNGPVGWSVSDTCRPLLEKLDDIRSRSSD